MGALIILHGLFLLHCNTTTKAVGSLQPQYCEILSSERLEHNYRVGATATSLVPLPFSTNLTVNLPTSTNKNPDTNGLDTRMMVFDSSVVTVLSDLATMRIVVPMPDNLYGANVARVLRDEVLTTTDPTALRSPAGNGNRMSLAESVILSYNAGSAFSLYDGATHVAGADSATIGNYQVLAFFAWPAVANMNCAAPMTHQPLNDLLRVQGQPTAFQLMGLVPSSWVDDPEVAGFGIPQPILRPPCIQGSSVKNAKDKVNKTATQTGCGPGVHI
jgi:hypothetical protein